MERVSTLFLKIALYVIAIPIVAACLLGLPQFASGLNEHYEMWTVLPVIVGLYAAAIPYFIALYQAYKLLNYIDKTIAFSDLSVTALKNIKYCAIAISCLFVAILPFLYLIAEDDDAPGLIVIGMAIAFASIVIAFFAAVLQKLLKSAIDIKSENDLTI